MRRRIRKVTRGKIAIQHAGTVLDNVGSAEAPASMVILKTEAGPRNVTGANQDITEKRDTGNLCNVGDVCKYVNLFIQSAPRTNIDTEKDRIGWLEWAFVCVKESETSVPITTIGAQTLGVICTNMFRNECIYTGAIPIGATQALVAPIQIKIPKSKCIIRIGDEWRFITYFRAVDSASASVGANRLVKSFMYKGYL